MQFYLSKIVAANSPVSIDALHQEFYGPGGTAEFFLRHPLHPLFLAPPLVHLQRVAEVLGIHGLRLFAHILIQSPIRSFKGPGAFLDLSLNLQQAKEHGSVISSHGNAAAARAFWAHHLGIKLHVVYPERTDPGKKALAHLYRATTEEHGLLYADAEARAKAIASETGAFFSSPYEGAYNACGAGIPAWVGHRNGRWREALSGTNDILIVPVGGGGLISGQMIALKPEYPHLQFMGAHPANISAKPLVIEGTAVERLGTFAQSALRAGELPPENYFADITDAEAQIGIFLLLEYAGLRVEGAAGSTFGPILRNPKRFEGATVIVTISGANMTDGEYFPSLAEGARQFRDWKTSSRL